MDSDSLKMLVSFVTALLAFAGGFLSFLSGRLREAEDADARAKIVRRTWSTLAMVFAAASMLAVVAADRYSVGVVLFVVSVSIQMYQFLSMRGPVTRWEVLAVGLMMATLVSSIAMASTFYLFGRVLDVQADTVRLQGKLVNMLGGK